MDSSFYYSDQDQVVRVFADSFEQITSGGVGLCPEAYRFVWAWVYNATSGYRLQVEDRSSSGYGPFEMYIGQPGELDRFNGYTIHRHEACIINRDKNGNVAPPVGRSRPGSNRRGLGYKGWIRICRGGGIPTRRTATNPLEGWLPASGEVYQNPYVEHDGGIEYFCPPNTQPDDCGGSCKTFFIDKGR